MCTRVLTSWLTFALTGQIMSQQYQSTRPFYRYTQSGLGQRAAEAATAAVLEIKNVSSSDETAIANATLEQSDGEIVGVLRRRKPVVWIHIHKAGGTTMCEWARQEGERVIQPHSNCNYYGSKVDGKRLVTGMISKMPQADMTEDKVGPATQSCEFTCESRAIEYAKQGAEWGQIEHEIDSSLLLCDGQLLYGIMLRHPLELLKSATIFEKFWPGQVVKFLKHPNTDMDVNRNKFFDMRLFDNFAVRMLNGSPGMATPLGALSERHLLRAKQFIENCDIVTVLEYIESRDFWQFQHILGWKGRPPHANQNQHQRRRHKFPSDFDTVISSWNVLDIDLYQFANVTAARRFEDFQNHGVLNDAPESIARPTYPPRYKHAQFSSYDGT